MLCEWRSSRFVRRSAQDSCDIETIPEDRGLAVSRTQRLTHWRWQVVVMTDAIIAMSGRRTHAGKCDKGWQTYRERIDASGEDDTRRRMYDITDHLCSFARVCTIISRWVLSRCSMAVAWSSCLSGVGSAKQEAKAGSGEVCPSVSPDLAKLLIEI